MPTTDATFIRYSDDYEVEEQFSLSEYGVTVIDHSVGFPQRKTNQVDIPGRNGLLDLNEALFGRPLYGNREISLTCLLKAPCEDWPSVMVNLASKLHGQIFEIKMSQNPVWTYKGTFTLGALETLGVGMATFQITGDCEPYALFNLGWVTKSINPSTVYTLDVSAEAWECHWKGKQNGTLIIDGDDSIRVSANLHSDLYGLLLRRGSHTIQYLPDTTGSAGTLYYRLMTI